MSSPEFTLSCCTQEDIEGMVQVYLDAFASNPFTILTFASCSRPVMLTWLHKRFLAQLLKREMRSIKIMHNPSQTLAAFLRYQVPHIPTEEEIIQQAMDKKFKEEERKEGRDPAWPIGAVLETCDEKFRQLGRNQERFVEREEMYVAQLLATSPNFQRKGLGSMLLRHVLEQADEEGRKVYIEATPEGHLVYRKLGFEDVDLVEVDLRKYGGDCVGTNMCMIRQPRGLGESVKCLAS